MKIPPTLKIGCHTYTVLFQDDAFDDDTLGNCDTFKQVLAIRVGLSDTQTFATLLHESIHAMNTTIEHNLLDSLAEQISQFLIDNKLVVDNGS